MRYKIIIGVVILVILAAAPSVYYFRQYQKAQRRIQNPTEAARQDTKETVAKVGKLISLPTDEEPTIAVVSDVTRLQDQPFFANAQNGDKVLIYTNAKKAILYRPGNNLIIEVAPVNIGNSATPSAQTTSTPSATPPFANSGATPSAAPKIIIQ